MANDVQGVPININAINAATTTPLPVVNKIPNKGVFLRRLINVTLGIKRSLHYIRLMQEVKRDLRLWHQFLKGFNCKLFFLEKDWHCGFGIVFGSSWTLGEWTEEWKNKDISFLELDLIAVGLIMWVDQLKIRHVIFVSNNESVVHVVNKQTTKDTALLILSRQLVLTCLRYNILFKARHIAGSKNILANSLSHLQVDKFKHISQGMDQAPTAIPPHLLPQNWVSFINQIADSQFKQFLSEY